MDPYFVRDLFGIQGLDIRWYAVIICVGICAGLGTAFVLAKKRGYNTDMPIDLLLVCIPLAIICARLYYVAFEWDSYKDDLWSIFAIWEGGIAIYGAVIGSVIGGFLFSKYSKISFGDILVWWARTDHRAGNWPLGQLCQSGSFRQFDYQ